MHGPAHSSSMDTDKQWHVLGAGSMGCLWAAYLSSHIASQGADPSVVTLLVRDEKTLSPLAAQAGQIRLEAGERCTDIKVRVALATTCQPPISHLLVATKAFDVPDAIANVRHLITDKTCIVLLQNGLKPHYDTIAQYGAQRVVSISTSNGAYLKAPFHVVHAGAGKTWIGQFGPDQSLSETLIQQLPVTQLNIALDAHIDTQLWRKFAINCSINILSALYQIPNGELLTHPQAKIELAELCDEVQQLLSAITQAPKMDSVFEATQDVLLATSANISSTLQDVRKWQKTELGQLNRYLCAMAQANGASCPKNTELLTRFEHLYPHLSGD